jgi:uncharacterized protein YbaR (Trm112 family)
LAAAHGAAQMNNTPSVGVLLGNSIEVASEQRFLARLRNDLTARGVRAMVLGNLHVGRHGERQLDFFIVGEHRHVHVELKSFREALIGGPNGRWYRVIDDVPVELDDNPIEQARGIGFAAAPRARENKFVKDFHSVVCVFPALPDDSRIQADPYVAVVGYDDLLDRLAIPGRTLAWSDEHWDAFARHMRLFRDDEGSPAAQSRRAGETTVGEYAARYARHMGHGMAPLAATGVLVDARPAARPDLASDVAAGRLAVLHGPSGYGKTLWARAASVELARRGALVIWISGDVAEASFERCVAHAIAPYSTRPHRELLAAAHAVGRPVVFVIDNLDQAPAEVRAALLDGVRGMLLRSPERGVLITAQSAEITGALPGCLDIELALPDETERLAVLAAYRAVHIAERCDAFRTPLELSLAAESAGELDDDAGVADLLDRHIDRVSAGQDTRRGALRDIARRMHIEIRPSLDRPDVARVAA